MTLNGIWSVKILNHYVVHWNQYYTVNQLSVQFSSVVQLHPTLFNPMDCSTPGLPVHHQLLEFTQTHVHRVGDAIRPSHPGSSPSPPAPNRSQHQSLFQWVNSSHQVAKVLEFQLQHQSFQWTPRTDFLQNGLVGSPCIEGTLKSLSCGLCGRGRGWNDLGEWHWNMYNITYKMNRQSRFDASYWMLGAVALGWPREMVWGGRWEGGSGLETHKKNFLQIIKLSLIAWFVMFRLHVKIFELLVKYMNLKYL